MVNPWLVNKRVQWRHPAGFRRRSARPGQWCSGTWHCCRDRRAVPAFADGKDAALTLGIGGKDGPAALVGDKDLEHDIRIDQSAPCFAFVELVAERLDDVGTWCALCGRIGLGGTTKHRGRRKADRHQRKSC